jgi:hypothetical protein
MADFGPKIETEEENINGESSPAVSFPTRWLAPS